MRTSLLFVCKTFVFAVVLAAFASAQSNALHVHVPFAFMVADQTMPAGDYVIEQEGHLGLLIIHGQGHSMAVITTPEGDYSQIDEAGVSFERRGTDSHLARVRVPGQPARLIAGAQR